MHGDCNDIQQALRKLIGKTDSTVQDRVVCVLPHSKLYLAAGGQISFLPLDLPLNSYFIFMPYLKEISSLGLPRLID